MSVFGNVPHRVETASKKLVRRVMDHPRAMLVAWAIVTLLPSSGILRLQRDTDGQAMVPRGDEAIRIDREVRARFELRDPLIVFFDTSRPDGIFDPEVLAAVQQVSDRLAEMPEIGRAHVVSLRTEPRDRLFRGWSETHRDLLTPLPETPRHLAELKEDLQKPAARLYLGTIVTADFSAAAIAAGVPPHGEVDREAIYRRIEALVAPFRREGLGIDVVGAPAAEATLATYILRDLALLVPLSMVVIGCVIGWGTRRMAPVVLAMTKVGACIVFTFGMLGWLGIPVFLTVAIVPVVLAAMSIADEIHVITRFQRALDDGEVGWAAVSKTFDELATPVVAATLTTCAGFLACIPSRIEPVAALGAAAAIGIGYSLAFTLCTTPALLVVLPARWFVAPERGSRSARLAGLSDFALRRPVLISTGIAVLTVLALAGALRLEIQDSWIDNFSHGSPLRRATDRVNARLLGVHRLEIHLVFPENAAFERADVLAAVETFEARLRAREDVGGVIGPWAQMATVADFCHLGAAFRRGEEAPTVLRRFDFSPGRTRRQRVIADGFAEGVVTIFLKHANYRDTARVMGFARAQHRQLLAPFGATLRFAGDVAVSQAMIPAVVRNQVLSLPLALAGVLLVVVLLCGSLRLAFYSILPVAVSGLWLLGILGWLGVPLGVATSMFFVIALGLGVDSCSIHLVMRFTQTRGDAPAAVAEVARPIVVNTLAVAGGFGLMAFSSVPANRSLGILIASGLVLGCLLTLTGLAALLAQSGETSKREEVGLGPGAVKSPDWETS